MLGEEVDMILDDHQVADTEAGVGATSGIADKERLDAQGLHDADGESDLLHAVTLVEVESALHSQNLLAAQLTEDELAGVTLDGRDRHVGNLAIRNGFCLLNLCCQLAQTCTQDDGGLRATCGVTQNIISRLCDLF